MDGRTLSVIDGTSGRSCERLGLVTAMALSLPLVRNGRTVEIWSITIGTSPATAAPVARPPLR